MPVTPEQQEVVSMFKGLPADRQAALLAQMSPEQKQKLNSALDSALGGGPSMQQAQRQTLASEFEKASGPGAYIEPDKTGATMGNLVPSSTLGSRAREAAIGVLEPFTIENVLQGLKAGGLAAWQLALGRPGAPEVQNLVKGAVTAPLQPVVNTYEGFKTGDFDRAAYGAGGTLSQTAPAVEGAVKGVKAVLPLDTLKDMARKGSQNLTASSAFKTTEPAVAKYTEAAADTASRQAEADAIARQKNVEAEKAAAEKTQRNQQKVTAKNEAAMNEADIQTEQQNAKIAEQNRADLEKHQRLTAQATEHNTKVRQAQARANALDDALKEGSQQIGQDTVALDKKLRAEGNAKYENVRQKVANDPGVPMADIAQAASEAEGKLSGSAESIKQLKDIARKAPDEASEIQAGGMTVRPGDALYERLKAAGALNTGENFKFKDLQGYSSEIGAKLAQGGLQGDVYQALKFLKEKIDVAKKAIAERNGVGAELTQADNFWNKYLESFYDKDSAVAKIRENTGKVDPEFFSEPITKGKSTGLAAQRLRDLPTQYADEANALADTAERLRGHFIERKGMKIPAERPLPEAPAARAIPPRAMGVLEPNPEPVQPKTTTAHNVPGPEEPTAESILADKREKIQAKGRNLFAIHPYDTINAATAVGGFMTGHPLAGLVPLASKYGLSFLLTRPSVIDWIAKPTTADFAAIEKLPGPLKAKVAVGLQQVIDEEKVNGKFIRPDQRVENFIARTSNALPVNRRDAREAMGQPTK